MSTTYVFNRYGGPEGQELVDRPVLEPGPGELGVKVYAAAVNPVDWKIRSGLLGQRQPLPAAMGREVAGIVTAVGDGVDGYAVGDEILGAVAPGHGGFAKHTIVRAVDAVAKPEEVSFADASTIPIAAATAYDGTHQIELEAGQTLLILGVGGGVGLMAAQIGKVHEFTVIGTASESKRSIVESTGATFVPYGENLARRLREIAPDGVDLILDLVGGDALREVAELATAPRRIISAADPATAIELGGSALNRSTESLAKITDVIAYGLVDPHVSARFPLERAGEAIAAVEAGHATGKIIVEIIAA
ncbi:NADP-dependent oxidoreductase [Salinibacterium sp. UTAS2018]|uniref:NADP-dependent oxidoreductase n=1 Tax=Salinibacterium sp. UTAS2018 TaxID=2508880 RepID=UPI0010096B35|nr:NADP-dependent oxidoreductase [Salinibacterium sp. UTAS2018]QAV70989.1 NADP-dependent oxidoreductase [Salinibacterium sp. UTAS2018]